MRAGPSLEVWTQSMRLCLMSKSPRPPYHSVMLAAQSPWRSVLREWKSWVKTAVHGGAHCLFSRGRHWVGPQLIRKPHY